MDIVKSSVEHGELKVNSTLATFEEEQEGAVRNVYFGGFDSAVVSAKSIAAATGTGVKEMMKQTTYAMKNMNTGTVMGTVTDVTADVATKTVAVNMGKTMLATAKSVAPKAAIGAGIGAAVMAGFEVVLHSYRYWNGDIETFQEYKYHLGKGLSASLGMAAGNWTGTMAGAAVGSLLGPIGTFIGGIIGGIIGGALGSYAGRKLHGKWVSDEAVFQAQKGREEFIRDALRLFGWINTDVIKDESKFNENAIRKKYRELAKQYHPDKNGGTLQSHADFHTLNASLGCLLSLLNKKDKKSTAQQLKQVRALTHKKKLDKIKQALKKQKLLYIVDICIAFDSDMTLKALLELKKADILELIDLMNEDEGCTDRINVVKKTKFAKIVAKDEYV